MPGELSQAARVRMLEALRAGAPLFCDTRSEAFERWLVEESTTEQFHGFIAFCGHNPGTAIAHGATALLLKTVGRLLE